MATSGETSPQTRRRYDVPSDPVSEILDGFLFLGDADQAMSHECLCAASITHVVNITINEHLKPKHDLVVVDGSAVPAVAGSDVSQQRRRLFFHLQDREEEQISAVFPISNAFIADAEATQIAPGVPSRVFVHCMAGRSRSVTLVLAYLMKSRRMSLREALTLVTFRRPVACPNLGFLQQLQHYEVELFPGMEPSVLPPLFQEALARFGESNKDSPKKAFQRFMTARRAAVLENGAGELDAGSAALISLVDSSCELVNKWQPGWSGGAVQEVLLQSMEELQPTALNDAVMFLKLLVTGDIFAAVQTSEAVVDSPAERKVGNIRDTMSGAAVAPASEVCSPLATKLTSREVAENFRSLQQDSDLRDNLRIDIPREAEYFQTLEKLLIDAGLLEQ